MDWKCAFPMLTIMEAVEHMNDELMLLEVFSQVQSKISSDFHDMQFEIGRAHV